VTRREFAGLAALGLLAAAGTPLWLAPRRARAAGDGLLVVVFQRGGSDGLHLVPPVGESEYARLRGALALSRQDVLPFVPGFGLHPDCAPLQPLLERGELAVVHAAGSRHPTRSHFEAQELMELGAVGRGRATDGWMSRALGGVREGRLFSAVAISEESPLSLQGSGALAIGDPRAFSLGGASPAALASLEEAYAVEPHDPVSAAGRQALAAAASLRAAHAERDLSVARDSGVARALGVARARALCGTRSARSGGSRALLSQRVDLLLALEERGLGIEAAFLDSWGWDTHANQAGVMGRRVRDLCEAIAKLVGAARGRRDVRVVVMTEFGRTVRPNGSGGSDHGCASAMLVAGTGVRGGLHGEWPGLRALYEDRDLAVGTDYRSVLFEVVRAHTGAAPPPHVFPGFEPSPVGLFA
jgi:uncharacterized protein (DUF1501 family)